MRKALVFIVSTAVVVVAAAQLESLQDVAGRFPEALQGTFLHIKAWQWLGLAFLGLISVLCGLVVKWAAKRITILRDRFALEPMTSSTRNGIGIWAGLLGGSLFACVLVPSLLLGRLGTDLQSLLRGVALAGGVLLLYSWWDAICDTLVARAAGHQRVEKLLVPMLRKMVRAAIVICGVLIAIGLYFDTKTVAGMIAGLGVGGLVVALAAKDSVENVFGSLTILFDMPFALGDWVKIDKVEGAVEEINLRSTRIRTAEDTIITLPNANLIRAAVENFGARRSRRQRLILRLSYDCDPKALDAYSGALRRYLAKRPKVDKERVVVELHDPEEASLGLLVQWFVDVPTYADEAKSRDELIAEALRLRKEHGVVFAAAPRPLDPA